MAKELMQLYPLSAAELAQAVANAGYSDYKPSDFEGARCERVTVGAKATGVYSFRYYSDSGDCWETATLYVFVRDGVLHAEW